MAQCEGLNAGINLVDAPGVAKKRGGVWVFAQGYGDDSPGGRFPRGAIPQGNDSLGEWFPRGMIPQENDSPGE